jgi:hypothetical protein
MAEESLSLAEMAAIAKERSDERQLCPEKNTFCKHCGAVWGGNCVTCFEDALAFTPRTLPKPRIELTYANDYTICTNFQDDFATLWSRIKRTRQDDTEFIRFLCDEFGTSAIRNVDGSLRIRGRYNPEHFVALFYKYHRVLKPHVHA